MSNQEWVKFEEYLGQCEINGKPHKIFKLILKNNENPVEIKIPDICILKICWYDSKVKLCNFDIH